MLSSSPQLLVPPRLLMWKRHWWFFVWEKTSSQILDGTANSFLASQVLLGAVIVFVLWFVWSSTFEILQLTFLPFETSSIVWLTSCKTKAKMSNHYWSEFALEQCYYPFIKLFVVLISPPYSIIGLIQKIIWMSFILFATFFWDWHSPT
jgi:hypothetical protein